MTDPPSGAARLVLGGARWSLAAQPDETAATELVSIALDAGIRLFDTAPAYTPPHAPDSHHNEHLIARALSASLGGARSSSEVRVVTKAGHWRVSANEFAIDGSPATLRRQCHESLPALGVDQLDTLLLHWPDPHVPIDESVGELAALQQEGLVRRIGVCNVDAVHLRDALRAGPIEVVQNPMSILEHGDREVLRLCEEHSLSFLAYSPLGGPSGAATITRHPVLARLATKHNAEPTSIALAWLLAQSPALIPVIGAGRPATLAAALAATTITLDPSDLTATASL